MPDDFEPNAEDQTVAEKRGVDLEHCFDKFMRVIRLQPKLSADWHTEFQLFLLREKPEPRDLARSLFARSQRLRGEERDGVDQPNCGLTVLEIFDRQPTSKPIEPKPKRKLTDWHKERARQLATDKLGLEGELVEAIIRDVEAEGGGPATLMRRCQAAGREKVDEQRAVAN